MAATKEELREYLFGLLKRVAPEADPRTIRMDRHLKKEIDLTSLDFLRLMTMIEKEKGYSVPETDYHLLFTLEGMLSYFEGKL